MEGFRGLLELISDGLLQAHNRGLLMKSLGIRPPYRD